MGLAFDPKGKWLASVSTDNLVHLWEVETGTEVPPFGGHDNFLKLHCL